MLSKTIYTTKEYWTDYYHNTNTDKKIINKICGKYDNYWDLLVKSTQHKPATVLEVGAYPGRYLAYIAGKYGLVPTGIDFNPDSETVDQTFRIMGIENGTYLIEDFLKMPPESKFDIVISNGFIEHFTNYKDVLDKHADFLAPGGAMLIMIPNKRYLRKWYGYLVDHANLRAHNLKCMSLQTFRDFAKRKSLKINHLDYHGGFAYRVHDQLSFWQKLIYYPVRYIAIRMNRLLSANPSRYWSGTIISILSKPT